MRSTVETMLAQLEADIPQLKQEANFLERFDERSSEIFAFDASLQVANRVAAILDQALVNWHDPATESGYRAGLRACPLRQCRLASPVARQTLDRLKRLREE